MSENNVTEKPKQGDLIEVEISDNGMAGEGIAHYGEYTVFVPFCIKGETVRAQITYVKRNTAFAELKKVILPSPDRANPPCNRFTRCGGCGLMHLAYSLQLEIKRNNVRALFRKNAFREVETEETVPCSREFGYRNNIRIPFGTVNGRTALGFYRPDSHKIVSVTKCFLHGKWAEILIGIFLDYAEKFNVKAYDEKTDNGFLKHLVARYSDGRINIVVVTADANLPHADYLLSRLEKAFEKFSLYQSIKPERTNVVLGKALIPIKPGAFEIDALGIKAEINPFSFLQPNDEIRDKIYLKIAGEIAEKHNPTIIDAYAGIGILGAVLSRYASRVYNIEIVKEARSDAEKIVARNNLSDKVTNILGDAKTELPALINRLSGTLNGDNELIIILDPPRKGIDESLAAYLDSLPFPHTLYYISCNPATLTRDINLLASYSIDYVIPYDMFPQTKHVETLVLLRTKSKEELSGSPGSSNLK